jgi:hypothetical protein
VIEIENVAKAQNPDNDICGSIPPDKLSQVAKDEF